MAANTLREKLVKIRDGFQKVESLTRQLGEAPEQEVLEKTLQMRETILTAEVTTMAHELTKACPEWQTIAQKDSGLKGLVNEAENLMRSIFVMDESIAVAIKNRMGTLESKMGCLYHASRAARSYTRQSILRPAQYIK